MPTQITLNFEPVAHQQWETCREYLDDKVIPEYLAENGGMQKKYLAADLEMSPSELRRKLCPGVGDKRNFSLDDLEKWLEKTRNLKPLYYLFEKYGTDNSDEIAWMKKRLAELEGAATGK